MSFLPANKVSDDVGVADDDFIAVFLLFVACTMKVLPECCLNTGSVLEELLIEGKVYTGGT